MNAPPVVPQAPNPRRMVRVPLAHRTLPAPPAPRRHGSIAQSRRLLTVRRLKAGMGLIEAAVKAGISPRLLSDLEDGRQHLEYDILGALAGVYGCQPSDLLQRGREAPAPLAVGKRRDTPRDVIEHGQAVLDAAMRADWGGERMAASFAVMKLDGALELYSALLGSVIEPGEVGPHLEDEVGAFIAALRRAADDVAARAEELSRLLPAAHDSWRERVALPSGAAASGRQLRRPV